MIVCDIENINLSPVWSLVKEIDLTDETVDLEEIQVKFCSIEKECFRSSKIVEEILHICIYCLKIFVKSRNLVEFENFGKSREIW